MTVELEKRFITAAATDKVENVIKKLEGYTEETYPVWLVISLVPPWQFATVEVAKLHEVDSADWDKPLKDAKMNDGATLLGEWFERSDVVNVISEEVLTDELLRDMAANSPSDVLIVQLTVGLFEGKERIPPCWTSCPSCGHKQLDTSDGTEVTCGSCRTRYCVNCGGVGTYPPC